MPYAVYPDGASNLISAKQNPRLSSVGVLIGVRGNFHVRIGNPFKMFFVHKIPLCCIIQQQTFLDHPQSQNVFAAVAVFPEINRNQGVFY